MSASVKKINIGKIMRERIIDYPVFKSSPKKQSDGWMEFPDFYLASPGKLDRAEREERHCYSVSVFASNPDGVVKMKTYAVNAGREEMSFKGFSVWLYTVKVSPVKRIPGKRLYKIEFVYIFRVKKALEENFEEVNQNE